MPAVVLGLSLAACTSGTSGDSAQSPSGGRSTQNARSSSGTPTGQTASTRRTTRATQTGHTTQTGRTTQSAPSTSASRSAVSLDPTFTHHANAICASGNAYGASHPFPVAHFDPSNPSPAQLPKVGRYLEAGPDVIGRLVDLTPPTRGATDWRAVVAVLRREHSNQRAQIQAARTSDPQNFSRTAQDAAVIERELLAVARAHGLGSARSCLVYFGG